MTCFPDFQNNPLRHVAHHLTIERRIALYVPSTVTDILVGFAMWRSVSAWSVRLLIRRSRNCYTPESDEELS